MVVYLDTSALVKLYVEEEGRELVVAAVEESERATVAYAETRATLARKLREGNLDDDGHKQAVSELNEEWPTYARLNVSNILARRAGELAKRHALRGFDSIHLASALRLAERFEDLRFLAFDARLIDAAKAASVAVYSHETNAEQEVDG